MGEATIQDLMEELEKKEKQITRYKQILNSYEEHFKKADAEFKEMQNETSHMRNNTEQLRMEMKRIITEYNNIVMKHKEIEEAFVNIAYMAKERPEECIEKLSGYYDEFSQLVKEQNVKTEKEEKLRSFTIIKGGK